jgi:hypothetical protein
LCDDVVDGQDPVPHELIIIEVVLDLLLRSALKGIADMNQITTCICEAFVSLYFTLCQVQFWSLINETLTAILTNRHTTGCRIFQPNVILFVVETEFNSATALCDLHN